MKLRIKLAVIFTGFMIACGWTPSPIFAHDVVLTWTAPTIMPAGSYINIYRGDASGAESATPINPQGIKPTLLTFTDSNVLPNAKYYYIAKQCAIDLSTNKEVCSAASNEASTIVPLGSGDLATVVLGAVGK